MTPIRLAVIGTGHLGSIHARLAAESDSIDLVAVVDPSQAARERLGQKLGVASFETADALANQIDAAVIATPTVVHHAVALPLLSRGIHLLVEKPLAANLAEANRLVHAATTNDCTLQVGHIERFNPGLVAAEPHIDRPHYFEARRYSSYTGRSADIGAVLDLMIHDLDIVLSLVEAPVERVDAVGVSLLGGHEDAATARIAFADGCVANLSASRISYEVVRQMHVWGAGSFVAIDFAARSAQVIRPHEAILAGRFDAAALSPTELADLRENLFKKYLPRTRIAGDERNAIADELADFAAAIREHRPPRVTGEAGSRAIDVAEQILAGIRAQQIQSQQRQPFGPLAA